MGYVGLSNAVLLSQLHEVIVIDVIPKKVEMLNQKKSPIEDNEIKAYLKTKNLNLKATLNKEIAYKNADFVIIANRMSEELNDVTNKIFTRDLFNKD